MSLFATSRSTNLGQIYLSSSEQCCIERFITQYIQTRDIEPTDGARQRLLAALEDYPRAARVALYELNAWLDRRLGLKAKHPEHLEIITRADHAQARLSAL
ncbi:hypothetical protein [Pseudomonas umsongensis]|uniref:hypothetical protein n=1 Tax=Pseudomonas umsongensis TaxID=198618 RepID=UPI00200AE5C5|nr:hypothetical protein [Pseudomonas umsongensis]MCK8685350.1 hypothetical protein [Pseudomonas umsongensis]